MAEREKYGFHGCPDCQGRGIRYVDCDGRNTTPCWLCIVGYLKGILDRGVLEDVADTKTAPKPDAVTEGCWVNVDALNDDEIWDWVREHYGDDPDAVMAVQAAAFRRHAAECLASHDD